MMGEFFNMGGYGFYIWWSFGATAVLIVAEWLFAGINRKAVVQRVQRIARLNETRDKF